MMSAEQIRYTKSLHELIGGLADSDIAIDITGVAIDSRKVNKGDLFLACKGFQANGVDYIDDAISAGAVAVAVDKTEQGNIADLSVPVIAIKNLGKNTGLIISRFFDEPSKAMQLFGVTGTNGKTTVSYMLAYALSMLNKQAALIGTLGYGEFNNIQTGTTTTPDPLTLQSLFSFWRDEVDAVAMEVSSHALVQGRTTGTVFDVAVFTNLSRDHLDYHQDLEEYANAKFQLFEHPGLKYAVINIDDEHGINFINRLANNIDVIAYSKNRKHVDVKKGNLSFVYCEKIEINQLKTVLKIHSPWGRTEIQTGLPGQFNIENILAVFSALCATGIPYQQLAEILSGFTGVPGRMETFSSDDKPLIVVDYAHTPDALEKALSSLRPYCQGRLFCVFGCGGERDTGKRAQMGAIAEAFADQLVLTNDNPRSESPEKIIEHILQGIKNVENIEVKYDRSDAITNTYLKAGKEDVLLIAGKGHETTQAIGEDVLPFSDRQLARRLTGGDL